MMFSRVATALARHISATEERCQAFEEEARGMKRALRMPRDTPSAEAAATWWWTEYMSLKDAVATLVDGKIRHEYDRHKATRTPNSAGIHWQKPGLRTGESHDNLRGLLKQAASAHAVTEFDDLDRRLVELQDNLKAVRLALVNEVRAVRVSKWGEEYQEFSFKRGGGGCGGGGGTDLRLGPPCGDSLEHCRCSQESPPGPVEKGSLGTTVAAAAEAAAAAAAAISENEEDIVVRRVRQKGKGYGVATTGLGAARTTGSRPRVLDDDDAGQAAEKRRDIVGAAAEHEGRRVARGGGNDTGQRFANAGHISRSTARGGTRGGRFSGGNSSSTDPGDGLGNGSLDEIKRQMGKNPLDLERKRKALDAEMLEGESAGKGGLRRSGSGRRYGDIALDDAAGGSDVDRGISSVLVSRDKQSMHATTGLKAADNGGQDKHIVGDTEEKNGEDGAESTEGWKDELMGMQPHERAEVYESKGMYREALRWHRQDLAAARERVQDGEEEDDRTAGLDLARALRNTGRCLGKLDMEGFAEAKAHLSEARELVGPDGPSPSPAEEQDIVLELGTLWYIRHALCSSKGVRFMADEALQEAVRFYRECRELCVDLLADVEDEKGDAFFQRQSHGDVAAAAKAISESRSVLLRAEFNLGMALVDQKNHGDAVPHLLAVQEGFRELAKTSPMLSSPAGSVDDPTQTGDGASDLKSLYASSLALLGDCYASSSAASMPLSAILQADNQGYGREGRKPGNDTAATSKAPMPLGAQSGPTPARLSAAIEALEKAAYTFLEIRDAGGALDVLDRLVKILRLLGHSRGGACYVSRAETLCDRASHALSLLRSRERAGSGGSEEEDANNAEHESAEAGLDLKQDLQQIRDDLFNLRERWYDGGSGDGCSNGGPGHRAVDENRSVRRSVVRRMDSIEQGNSESSAAGVGRAREEAGAMSRSHEFQPPSGGGTRTSTGADPGCQQLGRIGPALSAPAFARRRRARTKDGMLPVSLGRTTGSRGRAHGGGRGTPVDARQVSVRNDSRGQIMRGDVLASEIERGGKQLGHDNAKSGSTGTTGECGDTFVQLRAALAAAVDESAQARKHMAEGRGVLSAYKETCEFLQVPPNSLLLARLLAASHRHRAPLCHGGSDDAVTSGGHRVDGRPGGRAGVSTLDLRSCRLSDRELQVLAHVISKDYGEAAVVGVDRSSMLAMRERDPAMFDSLLLGGNPGIGIGGLTALSGFGGGNSDAGTGAGAGSSLASENFMTTNLLFRWLVRLDLSRCGLTAADLAGLAAPQAPPSAHRVTDDVDVDLAVVASHGNAGSFERCALRVLKLGDNPLTRVGARAGPGRGRGVSDAVERAAEHGLAALQDLIVRAPSLELLDLSGCSQLPDGPSACLYSARVSAFLASSLASGLEGRLADKAKAVSNGDDYSGGGRSNQVSTLRLGRNVFSQPSWERVLLPLSTHPPRELHLNRASVLFASPTAPATTLRPNGGHNPEGPGVAPTGPSSGRGGSESSTTTVATTLAVRRSFTADDKNVDDCGGDGVGRMLADLLAATVLPVDAEGVEVLNLTGSTGVLLPPMHGTDTMNGTAEGYRAQGRQNSSPSNVGLGETSGVEQERAGSDGRTSPRSDFVFSSVFRDALMSPLCRTTHLALSTARGRYRPGPEQQNGPPVREGTITTENKLESVSHGPYYYIGPKDVLGLCEAASACSSLRYLDLAGSDLSGSAGATAAAVAVSCLLRSTDIHGVYDSLHDVGDFGQRVAGGMGLQDVQLGDNIVSVSCGGGLPRPLTRLSLRACRLGAAGLSAVLGAVTAGVVGKDAADQNRPNCASDTEARKWGTTGSNVNLRGGVQSPFGQGGGEESRRHGRDGRGGRQRRHQALTMLPRLLDLADNRPPRVSTAGGLDVRGNRRGDRGGGQTGREGMGEEDASLVRWQAAGNDERDAVAEIAAALRLLENEGMAIMAAVDDFAGKKPSLERRREAIGTTTGSTVERACINLSGNRLDLEKGGLWTTLMARATAVANRAERARHDLVVTL